jgi:hypothetical protein
MGAARDEGGGLVALYLNLNGGGWIEDPQREEAARVLSQYDIGSVESRAAARALLVGAKRGGPVYVHEDLFKPEHASDILTRLQVL